MDALEDVTEVGESGNEWASEKGSWCEKPAALPWGCLIESILGDTKPKVTGAVDV